MSSALHINRCVPFFLTQVILEVKSGLQKTPCALFFVQIEPHLDLERDVLNLSLISYVNRGLQLWLGLDAGEPC